jgi:hypothetical protein
LLSEVIIGGPQKRSQHKSVSEGFFAEMQPENLDPFVCETHPEQLVKKLIRVQVAAVL